MVAVKQYLKPVSTTTNKALHIGTKEMPRNCRRLSGMPKTQEQIPPSNGASRPKLVHINREHNRAISVLPRNSLFYNSTPPQRSIKDQSLATNDATKTSSNRKFYYVVLLIECDACYCSFEPEFYNNGIFIFLRNRF